MELRAGSGSGSDSRSSARVLPPVSTPHCGSTYGTYGSSAGAPASMGLTPATPETSLAQAPNMVDSSPNSVQSAAAAGAGLAVPMACTPHPKAVMSIWSR